MQVVRVVFGLHWYRTRVDLDDYDRVFARHWRR